MPSSHPPGNFSDVVVVLATPLVVVVVVWENVSNPWCPPPFPKPGGVEDGPGPLPPAAAGAATAIAETKARVETIWDVRMVLSFCPVGSFANPALGKYLFVVG